MSKIELRDYQRKAVDDIRSAYQRGFKAPFLTAPTGSGKTVILSDICARADEKQTNTLFLVHKQELVVQTAKTLAKFGIPHTIIAPAKVVNNAIRVQMDEFQRSLFRDSGHIYVATVQTFVNRMADLPRFDLILIDEAHHGVAGTWLKIVKSYPGARLLGVSATPERLDGKGLGVHCGGIFDNLVLGPSVKSLIARGFLTKPRVYCPPIEADFSDLKTIAGILTASNSKKNSKNRESSATLYLTTANIARVFRQSLFARQSNMRNMLPTISMPPVIGRRVSTAKWTTTSETVLLTTSATAGSTF